MARETEKIIEVAGQRYKLTKLDADTGCYVAFKLAGVALPLLMGAQGSLDVENIQLLSKAISGMNKTDFMEIQKLLLGTVLKLQTSGGVDMPMPVLKSDGSYAEDALRSDARAVISLVVQAALFNVGSFFTGQELDPTKD